MGKDSVPSLEYIKEDTNDRSNIPDGEYENNLYIVKIIMLSKISLVLILIILIEFVFLFTFYTQVNTAYFKMIFYLLQLIAELFLLANVFIRFTIFL